MAIPRKQAERIDAALRDVAGALGVPCTTVYNHVRSPEALGRLVLSSILTAYTSPVSRPSEGDPWTKHLQVFADQTRAGMLASGPSLRFYEPAAQITPDMLRRADHLIGILVQAGFSTRKAPRQCLS